ncbi:MAG TPA: DUF3341 domain-containing protein [Chthoniobacteraceae bacterium]|jgi:hypothetical protein|nr:DUF3341 domain-containing protein [Chthoniobacteraceae bacterium]
MSGGASEIHKIYGVIAEFSSAEQLVAGARRARAEGYRRVDAYAPFAVEDLPEALDLPKSRIPLIMFAGGIGGAATGLGMQYYASLVSYPINIGGRPQNSWPAFIPPAFELMIFFAVVSGLLALFFTLHLPAVYHPVFNHPDFRRASRDGFFLSIEAADDLFNLEGTSRFLHTLAPLSVKEVEK